MKNTKFKLDFHMQSVVAAVASERILMSAHIAAADIMKQLAYECC